LNFEIIILKEMSIYLN